MLSAQLWRCLDNALNRRETRRGLGGRPLPSLLPFLLLGTLFCLITLTWLSGYALAAAKLSDVLRRPAIKAAIDAVCGVVLVGLGIRLALERR